MIVIYHWFLWVNTKLDISGGKIRNSREKKVLFIIPVFLETTKIFTFKFSFIPVMSHAFSMLDSERNITDLDYATEYRMTTQKVALIMMLWSEKYTLWESGIRGMHWPVQYSNSSLDLESSTSLTSGAYAFLFIFLLSCKLRVKADNQGKYIFLCRAVFWWPSSQGYSPWCLCDYCMNRASRFWPYVADLFIFQIAQLCLRSQSLRVSSKLVPNMFKIRVCAHMHI